MLTLFPDKYTPAKLPSGCFTVDRKGQVVISTLPSTYPRKSIQEIGKYAIRAFELSRNADIPLSELIIHYAAIKMVAKELRGGAIVYLKPVSME